MTSQGGDIHPHPHLTEKGQRVVFQTKKQHVKKAPNCNGHGVSGELWRFQCGWRSGVWSGASESDSGDGLEPVSEKAPMLCQGLQILSYGKEGGRKVLD